MGSWAGTCGITQLPINDDECRIFLIVENHWEEKTGSGYCYINDVWYPRGLSLFGHYNDYGALEDIKENINSEILLNGLKQDWVTYIAKNEWEKDVSPNDLTISSLMEEVERDRALIYEGPSPTKQMRIENWIKTGNNELLDLSNIQEDRPKRTLGMMFILEDIYQSILKYDPIEAHHTDEGYLYRHLSEILCDDMKEWYTKGLEVTKKIDFDKSKIDCLVSNAVSHKNSFNKRETNSPYNKGVKYYYDFLRQKMIEGVPYEESDVQTVTNELIDYTKLVYFMNNARKAWTPQCGKGSQDNNTDVHKLLAKVTLAVCKKQDAIIAEWGIGKSYITTHNKQELARRKKIIDGNK
jgi:hypothetical protein